MRTINEAEKAGVRATTKGLGTAISRFFVLTALLFLAGSVNAQSCGQVFRAQVSPQTLINDTVPTVLFEGPPPFLANGTVTVVAQGCALDIESGLDVRAISPDGSDTVLGDAFVTARSPQTILFPLRSPKLLVAAPTPITVKASFIAFGRIQSTVSSSFTLLPFNPTFSIAPSQIRAASGSDVVGTLVLDAPAVFFRVTVRVCGGAAGDLFGVSNSNGLFLDASCNSRAALFYPVGSAGQTTFTFQLSASIHSSQAETLSVTADWGGGVRTTTLRVSGGPQPPSLIDPIAAGLLNGTSITTDPARLQAASQTVQGLGADGVARVVVRIPATHSGEIFSLSLPNSSSSDEDGGLADINDQTNFFTAIDVAAVDTPQGPTAFAVYLAPLNYLRASDDPAKGIRIVQLQMQSNDSQGSPSNLNIFVYRPPVVLVHGLWDTAGTWAQFSPLVQNLVVPLANEPFYVQAAHYDMPVAGIKDSTPSYITISGVLANALGFSFNAPTVAAQIRKTIREFEQLNNIAAVQADVVAHSMGGDVVRTLALSPNFLSSDTYGSGPIDKLITIGTPHLGSPLAIQLLQDAGSNSNTCVRKALAAKGRYSFSTVILSNQSTQPGAVGDLSGDGQGGALSPALSAFKDVQPPFPVAYIAAMENGNNLAGLNCTKCAAADLRRYCGKIFGDPLAVNLTPDLWPSVFNMQPSDGVVPVTSQLNGGSGSPFEGLIHSAGFEALSFVGPAELDAQANGNPIPQKVIDLLNEPSSGPDFSSSARNE